MTLGEFLRHKKLNIAIFVVTVTISLASVVYGNIPVSKAVAIFHSRCFVCGCMS